MITVSGEAPNRIVTIEKEPGYSENWLMEAVEYVLSANKLHGSSKYYVSELQAEDNVIWGTDGSRLHVVRDVPVPDGSYAVVSKSKQVIVLKQAEAERVPKYKSIIDRAGRRAVELPWVTTGGRSVAGLSSAFAVVVRNLTEKLTVNVDYLRDALSGDCSFIAYIGEDKDSIIFEGADGAVNRLAVIMPQTI
jgi:hypothetical protein